MWKTDCSHNCAIRALSVKCVKSFYWRTKQIIFTVSCEFPFLKEFLYFQSDKASAYGKQTPSCFSSSNLLELGLFFCFLKWTKLIHKFMSLTKIECREIWKMLST